VIEALRPLGLRSPWLAMPMRAGEASAGFWVALGTFRDHYTHDHQIFTRQPIPELAQGKRKGAIRPRSLFAYTE